MDRSDDTRCFFDDPADALDRTHGAVDRLVVGLAGRPSDVRRHALARVAMRVSYDLVVVERDRRRAR